MKQIKYFIVIIVAIFSCLSLSSCAYNNVDERGEWEGAGNTVTGLVIAGVILAVGAAVS